MFIWIVSFIIVEIVAIFCANRWKGSDIQRIFYEDIPSITLVSSDLLYSMILFQVVSSTNMLRIPFMANIFMWNILLKFGLQLLTTVLYKQHDYFHLYKRYLEHKNIILDSAYVLAYSGLYYLFTHHIKLEWSTMHSLLLTSLAYLYVVISFEDL